MNYTADEIKLPVEVPVVWSDEYADEAVPLAFLKQLAGLLPYQVIEWQLPQPDVYIDASVNRMKYMLGILFPGPNRKRKTSEDISRLSLAYTARYLDVLSLRREYDIPERLIEKNPWGTVVVPLDIADRDVARLPDSDADE